MALYFSLCPTTDLLLVVAVSGTPRCAPVWRCYEYTPSWCCASHCAPRLTSSWLLRFQVLHAARQYGAVTSTRHRGAVLPTLPHGSPPSPPAACCGFRYSTLRIIVTLYFPLCLTTDLLHLLLIVVVSGTPRYAPSWRCQFTSSHCASRLTSFSSLRF